ncbi:hypothetical protein BDR07DRAFT_1444845 [Suillus spraguei]|nr:hypothetical protein BDR07DRAFT_1444845 [Suillus spraguei]
MHLEHFDDNNNNSHCTSASFTSTALQVFASTLFDASRGPYNQWRKTEIFGTNTVAPRYHHGHAH